MFEVSSASADFWYAVSQWTAIICGALLVPATVLAYTMSGIRESYADLRLSENERATAEANAQAAAAREKAAAAELALAKIRDPRLLDLVQREAIINAAKPHLDDFGKSIRYQSVPTTEARDFTHQVIEAFEAAGFVLLGRDPMTAELNHPIDEDFLIISTEWPSLWRKPDERAEREQKALKLARLLAKILAAAGFTSRIEPGSSMFGDVTLIVPEKRL